MLMLASLSDVMMSGIGWIAVDDSEDQVIAWFGV